MDEEVAVDNVNMNNEEKIKQKKKKDKKGKKRAMAAEEALNVDTMNPAESDRISVNECISEGKRDHKSIKEKKKKTKKTKGAKDDEADMMNGVREVGGQKMDTSAEWNCVSSSGLTMDTAERKRSRRGKKDEKKKPEMQDTEEVKRDDNANSQEGENVSGKESANEVVDEKKKKRKVKGNSSKAGGEDGEVIEMLSENRIANNVTDIRKETKKDKKKKPEMQDTEEVTRDDNANCQDGESVSGKESGNEVVEEKKKKKKKRKVKGNGSKAGGKDGEVIEMLSENRIVNNVTDIWKEMEKDKKKSKGSSFIGSKDTSNETKFNGADMSSKQQDHALQDVEDLTQISQEDGNTKTNHERKKEKSHDDLSAAQQDNVDNENNSLLNTEESQNNEAEFSNKRKKKKTKCAENGSNDDQGNEAEYANNGKKRKMSLVVNGLDGTSPNKSNKKVRFSDQDEVFTLPTNSNTVKADGEVDNLVRGKRFTREEDEIVKDAVFRFIEENDLGDEGLDMVLKSGKHRKLRGCWKKIASAIPYRPYLAFYARARILFMRSESRKWTQEEYKMVLEYQEKHGNQWQVLADELGKHAFHVKDLWRRIKLPDLNKGNWSQEEYQRLFDLVNTDLQLKVYEEKKSKHGMLRDNISWTAISDTHSTRAQWACCKKWYNQLTSAMVTKGVWADSDDYRLLRALYSLDATCLEDVDWDDLIDHRPGDICRKRWNQMVLHIGQDGTKSFAKQVEVLAQRYCPHLLEARVTWDNKPRVP